MIPEITIAQMQQIERLAEQEYGLTSEMLMENAGCTVAVFIREHFNPSGKVSFLIGKGHNGGDGLVAARHLIEQGIKVEIILAEAQGLKELTEKQLNKTRALGIPEADFPDEGAWLVVDCLLGYGAKGRPDERISDLLIVANALSVPKLAVDIPTGFEAEENSWHIPFFARSILLTLGLPKPNLLNNPNIKEVFVGDIGIPVHLYNKMGISGFPVFTDSPYLLASTVVSV